MIERVLFLPGAGGDARFWAPVAERLIVQRERVMLGWPGFGPTPPDPAVGSLDDLYGLALARIDRPVAIVAQSMGGVLALRAALDRPSRVRRLVLVATSGGIDLSPFETEDWRPGWLVEFPSAPHWFVDDGTDLSPRLYAIRAPVLLLWGDRDRLSPIAVGRRLAGLLPDSRLEVIAGGGHSFAHDLAAVVAPLVDGFLGAGR